MNILKSFVNKSSIVSLVSTSYTAGYMTGPRDEDTGRMNGKR